MSGEELRALAEAATRPSCSECGHAAARHTHPWGCHAEFCRCGDFVSYPATAPDEALRELAEAATPGPWQWYVQGDQKWALVEEFATEDRRCVARLSDDDDAAFIAAANPTAVLALLDERDALQAALERVRALLDRMDRTSVQYETSYAGMHRRAIAELRDALGGPQ